MKARRLLLASLLALMLVGSSAGFAAPPQLLTLSLSGEIFSSGSQQYSHQGGNVVAASVLGQAVDPQATTFRYSLSASVSGVSVTGLATFDLRSSNGAGDGGYGHGRHGGHGGGSSDLEVEGRASLTGMWPGEAFPLGCSFGVDCTSAIAAAYTGLADVTVTQSGTVETLSIPMVFESAFLNPGGGPIFMASTGGELVIISTYTQASVVWSGIKMAGIASGSFSGNPISGQFGMGVNAYENLAAGFEIDSGTIAFTQMSNPSLNAYGHFFGRSTIPPGVSCPSELGFPPGTCTLTGFSSSGVFSQTTQSNMHIIGKYSTTWEVPAVAFTSSVTAMLG